jgi:hypothetical protein
MSTAADHLEIREVAFCWNLEALTVVANSATDPGSIPTSSKNLKVYLCKAIPVLKRYINTLK